MKIKINAVTLGYLGAFANAIGAALITFNVALTQTQLAAIVGCVNAGVLFLGAAFQLSGGSTSATVPTP